MPTVVFKKDGTAMVHYSKEELHELIEQTRLKSKQPEGVKVMEHTK